MLREIKRQQEEDKEFFLKRLAERDAKIEKLEKIILEKEKQKETEDNLSIIRSLREKWFEDLVYEDNPGHERIKSLIRDAKFSNAYRDELKRLVNKRISLCADELKVSVERVEKVLFEIFPELKDVLEGKL